MLSFSLVGGLRWQPQGFNSETPRLIAEVEIALLTLGEVFFLLFAQAGARAKARLLSRLCCALEAFLCCRSCVLASCR